MLALTTVDSLQIITNYGLGDTCRLRQVEISRRKPLFSICHRDRIVSFLSDQIGNFLWHLPKDYDPLCCIKRRKCCQTNAYIGRISSSGIIYEEKQFSRAENVVRS